MRGPSRERRQRAVGQRDDAYAACGRRVDGAHRRHRIRFVADRHQHVVVAQRVDLVLQRAADAFEQHAVAGDQVVGIAEFECDAEACANADEAHPACIGDRLDDRFHLRGGIQREHRLNVVDLRR